MAGPRAGGEVINRESRTLVGRYSACQLEQAPSAPVSVEVDTGLTHVVPLH